DAPVLARVQNNALKADKDEQALTVAEVFRAVTDGVWGEPPNGAAKETKRNGTTTVVRRNLQREHLKELTALVLGSSTRRSLGIPGFYTYRSAASAPADARSLARMHLREIGRRIEAALGDKQNLLDDTTRAHLEECQERINKVLTA